jgi:hypothetical protein
MTIVGATSGMTFAAGAGSSGAVCGTTEAGAAMIPD